MNEYPGSYAGVVSRGIAFGLDVVISGVVVTLGAFVVRVAAETLGMRTGDESATAFAVSLPLGFVAYCVAFWSLAGRTPGMSLLGIRVVTMEGSPPGPARCTVRAVSYAVSAILLLGFAWILVDPHRQGFHDKIARTLVVYDHAPAVRLVKPGAH